MYDCIVVGSGFGGVLAAIPMVEAGWKVLMLERGSWVERSQEADFASESVFQTKHYALANVKKNDGKSKEEPLKSIHCVGGASVFYGGVSLRFRIEDFVPPMSIIKDTAAEWPFGYAELEPWYSKAEELLGVSGTSGQDPTEPFRTADYQHAPAPLSQVAQKMEAASRNLGLLPFSLPLAINQSSCAACSTCDTYACPISAKNDLATGILPKLLQKGLKLKAGVEVVRLHVKNGQVYEVECHEVLTHNSFRLRAKQFVLAAGTIGSNVLALTSNLQELSPAAPVLGRYLMRHCIATVMGVFPGKLADSGIFHKQLGWNDFYLGDPRLPQFSDRLGHIQQVVSPTSGQLRAFFPSLLSKLTEALASRMTGLIVIAEDQPQAQNRIELEQEIKLYHQFSKRDLQARAALIRRAQKILRAAGAWLCPVYKNTVYCHALGGLRMGEDPRTSIVTPEGQFRGLKNLWVTDGSVFPTSAAVNPSLTIAANALRVGSVLCEEKSQLIKD